MTTVFEDRTCLVTGAASGIGLAAAKLFADGGAKLVLVDIDGDALEREWSGRTGVSCHAGDVGDEDFWNALENTLPNIDHAIVNAGISSGGPIAELDFAEWRRVMHVNLDGVFLTLRAAMRAIREGGAIVITASAAGLKAEPGIAAYGASKAAVIHLARIAAKEGAPRGVRVNAIAPGGVETPIWDGLPFFDDLVAEHGSRQAAFGAMAEMATPLGRYANAGEIASQIAFFLSDDAATITGAVLTTDGGYTL